MLINLRFMNALSVDLAEFSNILAEKSARLLRFIPIVGNLRHKLKKDEGAELQLYLQHECIKHLLIKIQEW